MTGATKGSAEIGYRIERQNISNAGVLSNLVTVTARANAVSYTDATATPGQRYQYRVVAFNAAGDSASTPIMVGPVLAVPDAPLIGAATRVNSVSALVRWTAPANAGGSTITGYTVRVVDSETGVQVDALRPAAAGTTSLRVNRLATGTAVRLQVLATNAVGPSTYSALSNAVTP